MTLAIRFSALGDVAMTIPALYDACRANPGERFLMLTRRGPARLFINAPDNLEVVGVDLDQYKGLGGMRRLADEMARKGVDRVVDLHDVLRTKALRAFLRLKGAKVAVIDKGRAEKRRLTRASEKHILPLTPGVERYRDTFRRAGLKAGSGFRTIFPSKPDPALFAAATPPKAEGEKWYAVAPFAAHRGKVYPPAQMEKVIEGLCSRPGAKVFLFTGGPEEEAVAAKWAARWPRIVDMAALRLGFEAEMALMAWCDAMLSMDSANMHLASLAGCRVVSVWGATHPFCGFAGWGQDPADSIQLDMNCRPCSVYGNKPCRRGDYHCLKGITPSRILKALPVGLMLLCSAAPAWGGNDLPSQFHPLTSEWSPMQDFPGGFSGSGLATASQRLAWARALEANSETEAALRQYELVRPGRLPLEERPEYRLSYGAFLATRGYLEQAEEMVPELRKERGAATEADFLEGYIEYRRRDFAKAKPLFARLPESYFPDFFLAQMDLAEGEPAKAYSEIAPLLADEQTLRKAGLLEEALRTGGLAALKSGHEEQGDKWLRRYAALAGEHTAADALYVLGETAYRNGNAEEARQWLERIEDLDDAPGQGASFILGQLLAGEGDDRRAALAFSKAARRNFDPEIGSDAIYNLITSSTRGAKVPFSSPAQLYEQVRGGKHGTKGHSDALAERFAQEYFRDRDFAKALECIEEIRQPSPAILAQKRSILYELGRQETISRQYESAARHLREALALRTQEDPMVEGNCAIWLGDALYGQGDYSEAAKAYATAAGKLTGQSRALALYNQGYALFSAQRFKEAAKLLEKAAADPALGADRRSDALTRLADCRFYSRDYAGARTLYAERVKEGAAGADYAAWRLALATGLTGDTAGKLRILEKWGADYPASRWSQEAMLELADTYSSLDRQREAAETFGRISALNPDSPQGRRAALGRAMALLKDGDEAGAVAQYRQVISTWPTSEESELANADLKRLAARQGTLAEHAAFLESVPGAPRLDPDQMEALAFEAAEEAWADDIRQTALLEKYLTDYPKGRNLAQALTDLADSALEAGRWKEAVAYADRLLAERPDSEQAAGALLLKAETIEDHLPARLPEALEAWRLLETQGGATFAAESWAGIMRTATEPAERLKYARLVQQSGQADPETLAEASIHEALALLDTPASDPQAKESRREGERILRSLAAQPGTLAGARANVELGDWLLAHGRVKESVELLTAFTDQGSPQQYWLARGFISLSDALRRQGDAPLADDYLRSLRENYPGDEADIQSAISSRLGK